MHSDVVQCINNMMVNLSQVEEERQRMQSEFESISATLRKVCDLRTKEGPALCCTVCLFCVVQEHEENVEQLKREMAASEEEYRKQTQIQVRSMRRASENFFISLLSWFPH